MNKAKWMQLAGGLVVFGSGAFFLWNLESILSSSVRQVVLVALSLYLVSMAGGAIFKQGEDLEGAEIKQEQALDDGDLDHGWRKNPFQKGDTSDKVLPRGNFLQKRNKFRKTIERPNSQGY